MMDPMQIAWHLVEGTGDIIVSINKDGTFGYVNGALLDKLQYAESEIASLNIGNIFFPGEQKRIKEIVSKESHDIVSNIRTIMVTKDGEMVHVVGVFSPLFEGGRKTATLALFRDITQQKKVEDDLAREREQTQFLIDIMTHDLANIHQEIISMLDFLILNEDLPNETVGIIKEGISEIERATHLISSVRKISIVSKSLPEFESIDVSMALLRGAIQARLAFPEKKLKLVTEITHGEYFVIADEYLVDVFFSLLHNALKHSKKKQVTVEVVAQSVQFTPFLRIEVKDDGPGIPDSEKELIFQESIHRQLTREGLGLGLTLVKKIVEHYGGYIRVEDRIPG